jgi:uncharacterized protein YukE
MMYPPSYAMDATAGSGGPSTILPQIVTGSPETILAHVSELLQKAQQFSSLIEEFKKAETQLQQAWSGHAADSAVKKIEDSLSSFTEIVSVINRGAQLLQQSATMLTTAQTGYTSVVGAVNPTVAGLMSNPYTYSAAVALSTSSSSALRGFITAVGALMKTLGAVNLASELTTVAQIIGQLEQLFNNKGTAAPTGTATSAPVTAPVAPTSVASAAGAAGLANPSGTAATPVVASSSPTSLQTGEQGLLHTPDGKLYTADGQPLLTANGTPAYQNYQPAALTGLPNQAGVAGTPTAAAPAVPTTPAVPAAPAVPATPAVAVPATPAMPTIPALSTAGLTAAVGSTAGLGTTGVDPSHFAGAAPAAGTDSWIPVDPSQHLLSSGLGTNGASVPVTAPVDTGGPHVPADASGLTTPTDTSGPTAPISHPGGTGDEITVTTVHDGTTTTVEVPMDAHETVTVNAEGTVTVG